MTTLKENHRPECNNLNLIRMLAALAVLVSHAWPITRGPGTPEPLQQLTGYSLGTLAVMVFFGLSGFLLTISLQRDAAPIRFLQRRLLRLWPGLFASLALVTLVVGPMTTTLGFADYFGAGATWRFVGQNLVFGPLVPTLPGVFQANPYTSVAGSIWTLKYEVACYLLLLLAAIGGTFRSGRWGNLVLVGFAAGWAALFWREAWAPLHPHIENMHLLSLPFAIGAALAAFADRLPRSLEVAALLLVATVFARSTLLYEPLLALALVYTTLALGLRRPGAFGIYNRFGDYSYGTYLYAFPLQGLAVFVFGPQTPWLNILIAFPATMVCAVLSWHLIEAPCLRWARRRRPATRLA
ncbi:MAG: acyltransferase [Pseudomonadota bacterium]